MNRSRAHRRPLTKAELLPLPVNKVRALSLEHHLALAVARTGQGEAGQLGCLLRLVYLAFLLRDLIPGDCDPALFRTVEAALDRCVDQALQGEAWGLHDADYPAVAHVVALHDRQLATVPVHRYRAACERIARGCLDDPDWTPIPPAA